MSDDLPPGVVLPDAPDPEELAREVIRLQARDKALTRLAYAVVGGWAAAHEGVARVSAEDVLDTLYPQAVKLISGDLLESKP